MPDQTPNARAASVPAAVILAGGRGERLGGVLKSEVMVGNARLLDRVEAALGGCTPLLVSHGTLDPAVLRLNPGMVPVLDLEVDYAGPLAGLCGALDWLAASGSDAELLVSVAVDTPFLPPDFVTRLSDTIGERAAAVAAFEGQSYPTNAIWRTAALRNLPDQVRRGTAPHSLKRLAAQVGSAIVDWAAWSPENPFANINTPEDLAVLRVRDRANGTAST